MLHFYFLSFTTIFGTCMYKLTTILSSELNFVIKCLVLPLLFKFPFNAQVPQPFDIEGRV